MIKTPDDKKVVLYDTVFPRAVEKEIVNGTTYYGTFVIATHSKTIVALQLDSVLIPAPEESASSVHPERPAFESRRSKERRLSPLFTVTSMTMTG